MKPTRVVTLLAHPLTISAFSVAAVLLSRNKSGLATRLAVGLPLGVLVSKAIKRAAPKPKPHWWKSITPRESMPSGHSTATAVFAASLVDAARQRRWIPAAVAAIGFVNAARVIAKEHRLREVLVGDVIGLGAAAVGSLAARRLADA